MNEPTTPASLRSELPGGWPLPRWWEAGAIAGLVLLGYGRVVNSYFLADDFLLIHNVLDGEGRPDWSVALHHLRATQYVDTFRPLVTLVHTVAYALWGVHPTGYHLLNLSLHTLNALLFLALLRGLSPAAPPLLPFFAAALFATHPIHPEAVTYIGSLPILACATFYLLALLIERQAFQIRPRWRLALGLACFALALASKEEAISLPLAVALVTPAPPGRRPTLGRRARAAARAALPYAGLLALYLVHRRWIFGQITPAYYQGVHGTPIEVLRGIVMFGARLLSPINLAYAGAWGEPVFVVVLAAAGAVLGIALYRGRPSRASLAFCVAAFVIFLIPVNKLLVFDPDPGLTNSRFLYLPSLPFAGAVALIVSRERRLWVVRAAVTAFLVLHVSQLLVNNGAWAEASGLMRALQQESRRLTGNMLHVEVANIPDTVSGVVFDRGGFRHALLAPFVSDNAMHHRQGVLAITVASPGALQIEARFPEPDALWASADPGPAPPGGRRILVTFRPREAKTYTGGIVVRHPDCGDSTVTVAVRGRGTSVPPLPTYLNAAIWWVAQFQERADRPVYLAAISDLKDGIPAEEVSVSLLPGSPWRLRYFPLTSDWQRLPADTPTRITDGAYRTFLLEFTPIGRPDERLIVPRISGLNAPTVMAIPGQTTIELVGDPPVGADPADGRGGAEPRATACPALGVIPAEIDFGIVPTSPQPLRQDRPFAFYGQAPTVLFWDDLRRRLVPIAAVEKARVLLHASGRDLSRWQRSAHLRSLPISASLGAFRSSEPEQFIATGDIDLAAVEAAYAVLRMRISGAPAAYARLSWSEGAGRPERSASVVVVPDGYWHTYAVPLHRLEGWRSTRRLRYLRLAPILSDGWVEIESFDIIGPIP
ncbi:MAG TPA: hypothetical protein VGT40_10325 [Methylomirabilota bacterium]|nr:hypothetical protein [Methylomirabilota bacterium]